MTTVVDIGCATRGETDSISVLIDRFHPDVLCGFDPLPGLGEQEVDIEGCKVTVSGKAAWTQDGTVGYTEAGECSQTSEGGETTVPCFDLSNWLATVDDDEIILKIDAEGAEYPLLERLLADDRDRLVSLLIVEWHDNITYADERKASLLARLRAPVEEWTL